MEDIALVGNPNCGKTTLFNAITGTYQRVGNWTGVTNEKKVGMYKKDKRIKIVDLPGLYSLKSSAPDEFNAYSYLSKTPPKAVINVVDGTNLERNLYLSVELSMLKIPTVIAVNMCDELEKNGIKIDLKKLSETFGVPVVAVSALKNKNVDELISKTLNKATIPRIKDLSSIGEVPDVEKIYKFIEISVEKFVTKKTTRNQIFVQKVDDVLMHKIWGIPIFFAVMTIVYFLAMKIGGIFGSHISAVFEVLSKSVNQYLYAKGVSIWIISLVCDAVINTIGGVISFLPQILILFALMAVIEDSGYAARATFLFDGFFRTIGLGGKSLLPMVVSCGCTVTGLLSTRTIEGNGERRMTVFLSPFMPCGAKTAVFAWFASAFFNGNALVAASMYFLGIICVGIFGKILKKFKIFKSNSGGYVIEIPTLRMPSIKNLLFVLKEKIKEFVTKAGLTVFTVSVFLWLLKSVGFSGYVGNDVEKSFLYAIGNSIKYIFYPLGFGNWQASVAVLSGTFAKEAVVETLELICSDHNAIFHAKYSAYAFMSFILLSPPCVAALSTAKNELGSFKLFAIMCAFQFVAAYSVALFINLIGFLITTFGNLLLSAIIVIIILVSMVFAVRRLIKRGGCHACKVCSKGESVCRKKGKRYTT